MLPGSSTGSALFVTVLRNLGSFHRLGISGRTGKVDHPEGPNKMIILPHDDYAGILPQRCRERIENLVIHGAALYRG